MQYRDYIPNQSFHSISFALEWCLIVWFNTIVLIRCQLFFKPMKTKTKTKIYK